jgi:hypothetical protein
VTCLAPEFTARVTNHLHRLGWRAVATCDYIEIVIPIEAPGMQAAAKRGDCLYVWPAGGGLRWEVRAPGARQGVGQVLEVPGAHYVQLVAEIDHLLRAVHQP